MKRNRIMNYLVGGLNECVDCGRVVRGKWIDSNLRCEFICRQCLFSEDMDKLREGIL